MKDQIVEVQKVEVQPYAAKKMTAERFAVSAFLLGSMLAANLAGADDTGLNFNVDGIKTSVMAILVVGVAISIAFAVYKVGKRATNKM